MIILFENENLKKNISCLESKLHDSSFENENLKKDLEKKKTNMDLQSENDFLKKKVKSLEESLAKFTNGTKKFECLA